MPVAVGRASEEDLPAIKALQLRNLSRHLSAEERAEEGFVTADYTMQILAEMHRDEPAVVAKDGDTLVGYALVVTRSLYGKNSLLDHLFDAVDSLRQGDRYLRDVHYCLVGQLCVAKSYRGRGVAQLLYDAFRSQLSPKCTCAITEVADDNCRSLRAHLKAGFRVLGASEYEGVRFQTLLWDWTEP